MWLTTHTSLIALYKMPDAQMKRAADRLTDPSVGGNVCLRECAGVMSVAVKHRRYEWR